MATALVTVRPQVRVTRVRTPAAAAAYASVLNIFAKEYAIVNVSDLNKFTEGTVVDAELLMAAGLIKKACDGVKVLGDGELTTKLTVKAAKFTKSAVEKIEKAGGKAEVM